MTIQYELDFTTDFIIDLLVDFRCMALTCSTAPHSVKLANEPAFNALFAQILDLKSYAFLSNIIGHDFYTRVTDSTLLSIDLYWS